MWDIDESKVALMKSRVSPIYEADPERLIRKNYEAGRIDYTTNYISAYKEAETTFIGVGTPEQPYGSVNLSYIVTE